MLAYDAAGRAVSEFVGKLISRDSRLEKLVIKEYADDRTAKDAIGASWSAPRHGIMLQGSLKAERRNCCY